MSKDIVGALKLLEEEKGISFQVLLTALEDALLSAYKKTPGAVEHARVVIDPESGEISIYELILPERPAAVVAAEAAAEAEDAAGEAAGDQAGEVPEDGATEAVEGGEAADDAGEPAEAAGAGEATAAVEEAGEEEFDLSMYDESEIEKIKIDTPENFGRIAAQTAKQVIFQRIREAERDMMFEEYEGRKGEIVTGIVQQSDQRYTLVDLGKVEALLPESEQVDNDRYVHGSRIKAVIVDVRDHTKGPQVIVSRRSEELIRKLFELEVPEVADGLVVIRNIAREPGWRSKIAVESLEEGIDPVGACVGPRGSRVRMVVSELGGEKIDIIPYNDEPARFVAKALSPAKVREVLVDDEAMSATVVVPDDELSLAIGKEGQNARLANKLTGWRIDIKSESQMSEEEDSMAFSDEEVEELAGRCCAVTKSGKRCPNAALPGTRHCGIPSHQKLVEQQDADDVEPEAAADSAEADTVEADAVGADAVEADAVEADAVEETAPAEEPVNPA